MAAFQPEKAKLAWELPFEGAWPMAVTFVGASGRLAAGNRDGQIFLWNLPDSPGDDRPTPARRFDGHTNGITRLIATSDGKTLISASLDHTVRLWDPAASASGSAEVVMDIRTREKEARRLRFRRTAPRPAQPNTAVPAAVSIGRPHRRDSGTSQTAPRSSMCWPCSFPTSKLAITRTATPPSGANSWLGDSSPPTFRRTANCWRSARAARQTRGKVHLLEVATGKLVRSVAEHRYGVTDVKFSADGAYVLSTGRDTTLQICRVADGKEAARLGSSRGGQFKDWLSAVSVSPDQKRIAAADIAGIVHVWEIA